MKHLHGIQIKDTEAFNKDLKKDFVPSKKTVKLL